MFFTITQLTRHDYRAIQSLRPPTLPVIRSLIDDDDTVWRLALPTFRFAMRDWSLLAVHEDTPPQSPYEFTVTFLILPIRGAAVIGQLHFNTRLQHLIIGQYDPITDCTAFPCTLLEFPTTLDSGPTRLVRYLIGTIPSEVVHEDDINYDEWGQVKEEEYVMY
jgi:hypothetical protein